MSSRTLALVLLAVVFFALRIPGLDAPYQQDEFKSVVASEKSLASASAFLLHPPLVAALLRADAIVFGGEHMRVLPLISGALSALLLFLVVRRRFDERTAYISVALFAVSFYGVWSSLMVDMDGAVLPFAFLAAVYGYDRLRAASDRQWLWALFLIVALLFGFLVKLSFILVLGALMFDALIEYCALLTPRRVMLALLSVAGFALLTIGAFFLAGVLNPAFDLAGMLTHADSYAEGSGRNWLQVLVQAIKALYYLSPLLLAPLLLLSRDIAVRARIFIIYMLLACVFYFVLFDFSRGALDKYLMFSVVPLAVLSGAALIRMFRDAPSLGLARSLVFGIGYSAFLLFLNFLPHEVSALYPKTAWFSSIMQGRLNILTPFNGGSGPAGFYVSLLFIFAVFALSFLAAVVARIIPRFQKGAAILIVLAGLSYNAVFIEEFSFGKIHGSVSEVLSASLSSLEQASKVITYNDIGAYELSAAGKYAGRFYAAPQFEAEHRERFTRHAEEGGVFLVIGIPPLYEGFYTEYFEGCTILFATRSKAIEGIVYGACQATP